jgi:antirestriction protein ArdC
MPLTMAAMRHNPALGIMTLMRRYRHNGHWARHPSRLARDFGRKRWSDEGYAAEKLVAELGTTFLCIDLGITPEPREDHASYIANWFEVLGNDKRAIAPSSRRPHMRSAPRIICTACSSRPSEF